MKLIPFEEIEKAISSMDIEAPSTRQNILKKLSEKIKAIHTIDPIEEIDNMIEELDRTYQTQTPEKTYLQMEVLRELKKRLSLTQK